ncbi:FCD domain-containing protein [Arthrobacter sp. NA-172]|uniref:FCD domain-containing protein n=1 Tax=Arthrobacter sp. NA-172 TaxID=3367524 RepID=UPI0037548CAE
MAELEALHHELSAAAARNNHELLEEKNHAFHREINLMANSRKTVWVLGLVTRYVPRQFYSSIPGWPQATMDDHAELLKGIQAHDPEATRAAMHQHIVHSGELLAAHFDERIAAATDARALITG